MDLARANHIPLEIRKIRRREVFAADELWMMSSTKDVIPITKLDGKLVGTGKPAGMFKQMSALFQAYKAKL
jgi:D-alanine transaminase